jgi:hypothetical protein
MPTWLRRAFLFLPPLFVGALNIAHPIAHSPLYDGIVHHVDWWISLHLLNLVGFPLVGFAGCLLTQGIHTPAAIVSRVVLAIFIPIYAAFDALAGIEIGTLVQLVNRLSPRQSAAFEPILTAYWSTDTIVGIAVVGSIAWTIAMLSAPVGFTAKKGRWLIALLSVIAFFVIGWARTNLMSADSDTISLAWWLVLIAVGLAIFVAGKPRIPAANSVVTLEFLVLWVNGVMADLEGNHPLAAEQYRELLSLWHETEDRMLAVPGVVSVDLDSRS